MKVSDLQEVPIFVTWMQHIFKSTASYRSFWELSEHNLKNTQKKLKTFIHKLVWEFNYDFPAKLTNFKMAISLLKIQNFSFQSNFLSMQHMYFQKSLLLIY